jgi:hypothetical protein
MGGSGMPMSPGGMLGHGKGEGATDKDDVNRARVVVGADRTDSE